MTEARARPAFYALAPGGWRDYVTLLHPPYTAWHLSYVVIGACLAPTLYEGRLAAAVAAFFLGLGISAHAIDELMGRPLQTKIPRRVLVVLSVVPLVGAVAIGIGGAIAFDPWLLVFVVVGAALVPVYNLELFGGAIHNDAGFALAWGAFPLLTGYFACAGTISWEALLAAAYATLMSYAQRVLSTPVRHLRRRVAGVEGTIELRDGGSERVTQETLAAAPERALQTLAAANVALAVALLVLRLA
jgi:heme O synthase-like polyprenyltransferase